ncbi:MAG: flagellar biosynthetic protein FliR [Rhodobacteraceae bacterium]|nr:flagellar biosynthetic protein FliR [Paracoccaceae bacterium]
MTSAFLVFARVGAVTALLPGFGEQSIPMRIRLLVALAFTAIVWPVVSPIFNINLQAMPMLMLTESAIGIMIGISIRLIVMALQLAGSIAAQATSIAQVAGSGATPDPMPAIGNILVMAGLTLVLVSGLHVKAALAMIASYEIMPPGFFPTGRDAAEWGTAHVAAAFALAITLASPFIVMSFAYNIGLGAINRAMPSLMVSFIGAPAITAGAILMLLLSSPILLDFWNYNMDLVLANPLGMP